MSLRVNPFLLLALVATLAFAAWWQRPWAAEARGLYFNEALGTPGGTGIYTPGQDGFAVSIAVDGLKLPWDLAFIDAQTLLVTEKQPGQLTRIDLGTGLHTPIAGLPPVAALGQGGLLAVTLHPDFSNNHLLYLSYAAPVAEKRYTTRVLRAKLVDEELTEPTVILSAAAESSAGHHFGGAMAFDKDGYLFVSVGERGDRDLAQDLTVHNGKILRLKDDGSVPADNPFVNTPGARPEIWSYGHRNPQGLDFDAATGTLWETEHGPRGGDEINRILPGRNYGWPVITYGKEYVGGSIGEGTSKPGIEPPVYYYVPSIATGGMSYYAAALFPQWKDSVLVASLKDNHLNRVKIEHGKAVSEERLLHGMNLRMRSVKVSPGGEVWVVCDTGVILRLSPPAKTT